MPELPEVETVRRGLAPLMAGARLRRVEARRADLRFPLPGNFVGRLEGARIEALGRRGKYLVAPLSTGESLIMHLGMSGRFTVEGCDRPDGRYYAAGADPRHDHVAFELDGPSGPVRVVYNDPRRFGLMDLVPSDGLEQCRHLAGMGPEPLSEAFAASTFNAALKKRAAPIKAALLDQRLIAGVGNIYACEALFRAGVSPRRAAKNVSGARGIKLWSALRAVLSEAIEAGGSSLRDFAASNGALGYFQHRFKVYGRAGETCLACREPVKRFVQSGRSTFYCGVCQR